MKNTLKILKFEYVLKMKYHTCIAFSVFSFFDKYANFNKYYLENCVSSSVSKNL